MKPRHQNRRIAQIAFFGVILLLGTALIFTALRQNLQHFYHPSEVLAQDFVPGSQTYKIGGVVLPGSIKRGEDLTVRFSIVDLTEGALKTIDNPTEIAVTYTGLLPDLFREAEQAVVTGSMIGEKEFQASEVLARHDESYEPVKVKK